jgi:hypothetical protein
MSSGAVGTGSVNPSVKVFAARSSQDQSSLPAQMPGRRFGGTAFSYLPAKLEPELQALGKDIRGFTQRVCYAYYLGTLPQTRRSYLDRRKRLTSLAKTLKCIGREVRTLSSKIQDLPDGIREAHVSSGTPIPILVLAGVAGPAEYFRIRSLPDPGALIEKCLEVLSETEKLFGREVKFLNIEIPRIGPLWKVKPQLWWQKGGFTYLLEQLFRKHAGMTVKEAHLQIIKIRRILDGKDLKFDYEKGYSPAISKARRELPRNYRRICDRVLARALKLPSKR